jgi:hypothetical protein
MDVNEEQIKQQKNRNILLSLKSKSHNQGAKAVTKAASCKAFRLHSTR